MCCNLIVEPDPRTQEPATDKTEVFLSTAGKETVTVHPDAVAPDVLSVSGTFVKVSPSASPVSFEEIGASYVEPMSLPSTPPLIAEPNSSKLTEAVLSMADVDEAPVDVMNTSSMSFIAVSTEPSEANLPLGMCLYNYHMFILSV